MTTAIGQYLELQKRISERAVFVGRDLQKLGHPAYLRRKFATAVPFLRHIDVNFVAIVVGLDENGDHIAALVPTELFENGDKDAIKGWVEAEIEAEKAAAAAQISESERVKAEYEVGILRELREKYPNA